MFRILMILWCCVAIWCSAEDLDDRDLARRIERLRCSNFELTVTDANGQPFNGELTYRLVRHHFIFGTALHERFFDGTTEGPDAEKYREIARTYFNAGVHERFLKWKFIEPEQGQIDMNTGMKVWDWCQKNEMKMRGHCIFWGTNNKVQPWVMKLDAYGLENAMRAQAERVLNAYEGKIEEYDLNNEMMRQDYYARVLNLENGARYFKWCKDIAPKAKFGLNEWGIIGGSGLNQYISHVEDLRRSGAEISFIGDQCRFNGPAPVNSVIWDSLNKLEKLRIPVQVTELSFNIGDETLQADSLKRFIRVCFAHPSVTAIYLWGFWEGECNPPAAALWKKDWTLKESGKAYVRLLKEEFSSGGKVQIVNGKCQLRGFYGKYEVRGAGVNGVFSMIPENITPELRLLKNIP